MCFFNFIISVGGNLCDCWLQIPKNLTTPLYVYILVLFEVQPLLVALMTVIICSFYSFTLSLPMIWPPFTILLLVSSYYQNRAIIYIFCQYQVVYETQPLPTIYVFASSYILRPTSFIIPVLRTSYCLRHSIGSFRVVPNYLRLGPSLFILWYLPLQSFCSVTWLFLRPGFS